MLTPYQFASNSPIQAIDLDGLEIRRVTVCDEFGNETVLETVVLPQNGIDYNIHYDAYLGPESKEKRDADLYYIFYGTNGSIASRTWDTFQRDHNEKTSDPKIKDDLEDALIAGEAILDAVTAGLTKADDFIGAGQDALGLSKKSESIDDAKDIAKNPFLEKSKDDLLSDKNTFTEMIKEHKDKLEDFKKDPIGNSSDEWLKTATKDNPSQEELLRRAKGRIPALEKQIKKQEGELNKINEALKTKE